MSCHRHGPRAVVRATLLVTVLLLAVGCGTRQAGPQATDRCEEPEAIAVQDGGHLIGDQAPPAPYNSTPPTSGWHASGALDIAVHGPEDPLTEPQQVTVLEVGGVVVTYRDLPADARQRLEEHVRDRYEGRVAVTPYEALDAGAVAFTAWGVLQRCAAVELDALDAFVVTYADEAPGH